MWPSLTRFGHTAIGRSTESGYGQLPGARLYDLRHPFASFPIHARTFGQAANNGHNAARRIGTFHRDGSAHGEEP
jgi:hypothetical protein